jgi:hypothetical protein
VNTFSLGPVGTAGSLKWFCLAITGHLFKTLGIKWCTLLLQILYV